MNLLSTMSVFLVFLAFSSIFLLLGYLVLFSHKAFNKIPFRGRAATSFLTGTILCVVFEAIFITRFNTVFSIALFLALLYLFQHRNAINIPFFLDKKLVIADVKRLFLPFFGFASIIFMLHYLIYFLSEDWAYTMSPEWTFYALAANSMNAFGVENLSMLKNMVHDMPASYYHYFDLWLIEMTGHYTGLTYGVALGLVVFPVLLLGVTLFIWAFIPSKNLLSYLWPFLLLAAVSFVSWKAIDSNAFFSELPIYQFGILTERSKRIYYLIWIILAAAYFLRINRTSSFAILLICLLPITHFGMIPFLCAFIFLLVSFRHISYKKALPFAATIALICIYYFVINSSKGASMGIAFPSLGEYLFTTLKIVVKNIGLTVITTVHILLLLALLWKKKLVPTVAFEILTLGLVAALGVWGVLHILFDSVQLFMVPYKALFMAVTLVLLAITYQRVSWKFKGAVCAVALLSLTLIQPENQKHDVPCATPIVNDKALGVIGFILPKEAYQNETKLSMQFNLPWVELPFLSKNKFPVSITEGIDESFDDYVKSNYSERAYQRYKSSSAYLFYIDSGGGDNLAAFKEALHIEQVVDCR